MNERLARFMVRWLLPIAAIWTISTTPLLAQGRAEGSIVGQVVDDTKAVLPGVTVTARNLATGVTRSRVTDPDGTYRLAALAPGQYEVRAELAGFAPANQAVSVTVGSESTVDFTLGVGGLKEVVNVSTEIPLVETTKTEQAVTLVDREVRSLPTNSRNFLEFALLAPGVVRARTSGAGWGGEAGFSTSGNRGDQNAINIDGLANRDNEGLEMGNFSQEAVQEFQVITQSYPAEFGGSAGGVINAVTKSGTNNFTGYGFGYLRHDAFDRPPFDLVTNPQSAEVTAESAGEANEFQRRVYGFSVGGPIVKGQTFFYSVLERMSSREPRVRTIEDATLGIVRQIAIPTLPDDESNKVTYFEPTTTKVSGKVDHTFNQQHNGAFRFSSARSFSPSGTAAGRNSIIQSSETKRNFVMGSGSVNSFFSQRLLNSARFQVNVSRTKTDWPFQGGVSNVLNFVPRITIGGGSGGSFGRSNAGGQPYSDETKWEAQNTLTWQRGDHTIKLGALFMVFQFWMDFQQGVDGEWTFSDINAFQAGRPSSLRQAWGATGIYLASKFVNGFVQDEWQVREGLTVNGGIRYELNLHPTNTDRFKVKDGTIDPNTGLEYSEGGQPAAGFNNDTNNIAPRLGMTYTPDDGRTLFRAAGGVFYGNHYLGELGNALAMGGPPMQRIYLWPSVDATAIWNGVVDPTSPFFNPTGARRLPNSYGDVLLANGTPYSPIRHELDLRTPSSIQGTLGAERQFSDALAVSGSFIWSRGFNNVRNRNINPQAPTFYTAGSPLPTGVITPYDTFLHLGPRADQGLGENLTYENSGKVDYKGMSLGLTYRKGGLLARASYTYSDAWDDSAAITIRQGPADLVIGSPGEWSRSILATRHRFVVSSVYDLPSSWPVLVRDWQVAGIVNLESGHPYQVWSGFDFNNDTTLTDRPTGVPRNSLWTEPIYNVDLRLARRIPLTGRFRLEAMFEMFNLFNRAHYDGYVDTLYVFDRASGQYVPRSDFAAFASSPNLNARDYERTPEEIGLNPKIRRSSVGAPFQGQLGLRFYF